MKANRGSRDRLGGLAIAVVLAGTGSITLCPLRIPMGTGT